MRPGPEERKLRSRLHFRLLGYWPRAVVAERLRAVEATEEFIRRGGKLPEPVLLLDELHRHGSL